MESLLVSPSAPLDDQGVKIAEGLFVKDNLVSVIRFLNPEGRRRQDSSHWTLEVGMFLEFLCLPQCDELGVS
jgi:hypothetical protein